MTGPGPYYLALEKGRNAMLAPIAARAKRQLNDLLDSLTKQEIIDRLAKLSWIDTNRGIPGIALSDIPKNQEKFIAACLEQKLVSFTRESISLEKQSGYYTYAPEVVAAIVEKGEFTPRGQQERLRKFFIKTVPLIAEIMEKNGIITRHQNWPHQIDNILIEKTPPADAIITLVRDATKDTGLYLRDFTIPACSVTDAGPDKSGHVGGGTQFDFNQSVGIGDAISAHLYLAGREQKLAASHCKS